MKNLHPIANSCALFHRASSTFLGSGFVFRHANTLLTAAHCVQNLTANDLVVQMLVTPGKIYEAIGLERHPSADVAIIRLRDVNEREIGWQPYSIFDDREFGLEVIACGFPEDIEMGRRAPTARVFRGHIQRFVEWTSYLGYRYLAAELSFRCPGGLSGGKLLNPQFSGRIYGIVTENIRTSNILDSFEEVQDNGTVYREHHESVIYYGMAVWLPAIQGWLDENVPPISQEELSRRGAIQHELIALDAQKNRTE